MISAAEHGKGPVDSQNGIDKKECTQKMLCKSVPGVNDTHEKYMSGCTVDENAKRVSFAEEMMACLNDPARCDGGKKGVRKGKV